MGQTPRRAWYGFGWWFAKQDTPEERKLLVKLDLLIIPYAVLAYRTMFFDQANLSMFDGFP
jgi:hypothetical protein